MNILVINHYAGATRHGMEYRSHYLAREWGGLGHSSRSSALALASPRRAAPLKRHILEEEIWKGFLRLAQNTRLHGNGVGRVLNILAFLAQLRRFASRLARRGVPRS